jgi:dienelactone hydrolase
MAQTVLLLALIFEIAFAAWSILTKSRQVKVRSYVRIGALAAFVVCTLAAIVQWGLRWYLLALLLFVWAALGAWTLLRKPAEKKEYRASRTVLSAVLALFLIALAVIPALLLPQYRQPTVTGPHPVATVTYTYIDPNRVETFTNTGEKRKINVECWYPKDGTGKYPLVVFSHGAFGTKTDGASTFADLASTGYVVCSLDHPYHSLIAIGADRKPVLMDGSYYQEFLGMNQGQYDAKTQIALYQKWMQLRAADINFALDTLLGQAKSGGAGVYQLIDTGKIGLIGHSMGGAAVVEVGRQRQDVSGVIDLDGDLLGEYQDFVDGKPVIDHDPYPNPILFIYSDDMTQLYAAITDPGIEIPNKYIAATAPQAFQVHIAGTDHLSLTDVRLKMPFLDTLVGNPKGLARGHMADATGVLNTMNARVLEFFDACLKGKGSFTTQGEY